MLAKRFFGYFERVMAAVAFAEAGEERTAIEIAFPEKERGKRKDLSNEIREENRPVLYS
jgi:hypothetical protein